MKSHAALDRLTRQARSEAQIVRSDSLPSVDAENLVLMCPGPVGLSARVKGAMVRADVAHRDTAFVELHGRVRERLLSVAGATEHEALLISGGATAATEAVLASFVATDERLLVISNGAFGERIAEIAQALGIRMSHLRYDWGAPIVLGQVAGVLDGDPRIKAVAMVHHETSVARINPVVELGRLLAPRHLRYFVDVVSSLGAEEFDAARARASVVIGSANKCLHGAPGVGFVLVRRELWNETAHVRPRTLFLDLGRYRSCVRESGQTPFTPAVPAVAALDEALQELEARGGVTARRADYSALNARLRAGLIGLGLQLRFDGPGSAVSLTVAQLPTGMPFDDLYRGLRARGFLVYRGKGPVSHDCFLVANMGSIDLATVEAFLQAVADLLPATPLAPGRQANA